MKPIPLDGLESRDGLLFLKGEAECIDVAYADWLAKLHGFFCAEQLVMHLAKDRRGGASYNRGWS